MSYYFEVDGVNITLTADYTKQLPCYCARGDVAYTSARRKKPSSEAATGDLGTVVLRFMIVLLGTIH